MRLLLFAAAPGPDLAPQRRHGSWTVGVGDQNPIGFADVPVYAEFRALDSPQLTGPVHVERAMRTFVPPPVPSGNAGPPNRRRATGSRTSSGPR